MYNNSLIWEYLYASIQLLLVLAAVDLSGNSLSHTNYITWHETANACIDVLAWQLLAEIYNDEFMKG